MLACPRSGSGGGSNPAWGAAFVKSGTSSCEALCVVEKTSNLVTRVEERG
jgi:hypothetical protein